MARVWEGWTLCFVMGDSYDIVRLRITRRVGVETGIGVGIDSFCLYQFKFYYTC
jgi:hypothetical protein